MNKSKNKNIDQNIECEFYLGDSPTFKGYKNLKVGTWNGWLQPFVEEKVYNEIHNYFKDLNKRGHLDDAILSDFLTCSKNEDDLYGLGCGLCWSEEEEEEKEKEEYLMEIDIKEATKLLTQDSNINSLNAVRKLIKHYQVRDWVFNIELIKRSWTEQTETELMGEFMDELTPSEILEFAATPDKVVIRYYYEKTNFNDPNHIYAIEQDSGENTYLFYSY